MSQRRDRDVVGKKNDIGDTGRREKRGKNERNESQRRDTRFARLSFVTSHLARRDHANVRASNLHYVLYDT